MSWEVSGEKETPLKSGTCAMPSLSRQWPAGKVPDTSALF